MVSVTPANPAQGFYLFDPEANTMGLPSLACQLPPPASPCNSNSNNNTTPTSGGDKTVSLEDGSKKVRKPYTITKSRESWTEQEHDKFLEALQLFDRDWKKIEAFVGSKTVIQIRSHAQKYFLKVQKSGTNEHMPPPRPKRKAAHPYPQKAPKNAAIVSHVTGQLQPSPSIEPGYIYRPDSSAVLRTPVNDSSFSTWSFSSVPPVNVLPPVTKDDAALATPMTLQNFCCSSSSESPSQTWQAGNRVVHRDHNRPLRDAAMPDFSQAYSFIGSVFDPNSTNHLEQLKQMDPINLETVLLLMRNLSANLRSPEFEKHRRLLASYEANPEAVKLHGRHYNSIIAASSGSPIPAV